MIRRLNAALRRPPVGAVWLLGAIPLALLVFDTLAGRLGVDPIRDIEHRLGRTALYLLIATLAVTPLLRLTGLNLMRFRRALGLVCFSYAVLHVAAWVVMDMGFLWAQMARDVVKRPYLVFGMGAAAILMLLAASSNDLALRRMGRNWHRLHRLAYLAAPLAVLHWLWALKTWQARPLILAAVILALLAIRLPMLRPHRRGAARFASKL